MASNVGDPSQEQPGDSEITTGFPPGFVTEARMVSVFFTPGYSSF